MITNEYGVESKQRSLLELMKDVDQLLSEQGIRYSLCGGTLLGAIRHDGFIPWDDDLDIMLDRNNFEKLLRLFKDNDCIISIIRNSNKTEYSLSRRLWVYRITKRPDNASEAPTLDIMVMDRCPDNMLFRRIKVLAIKTLQGMMHEKPRIISGSFILSVCLAITYLIGRLFTDRFKYRMYNAVSMIGNGKKTQYITGYNDLFKTLNCRYSGKLMDELISHTFEDTIFPITADYDNYLSIQYGDYMILPPVKERIPNHM